MYTRKQMILAVVGVLALVAIGLPALWHQPDLSGFGGTHEALAGEDDMKEAIQDHLDAAAQYEKDAERREAEAARFEKKASAITPNMDPKGFRREGMRVAADSNSSVATELRFRAKVHRLEAELLKEKAMHAGKEK
jgi:hypothetical protein